mgnify:CR=1 FL=1
MLNPGREQQDHTTNPLQSVTLKLEIGEENRTYLRSINNEVFVLREAMQQLLVLSKEMVTHLKKLNEPYEND